MECPSDAWDFERIVPAHWEGPIEGVSAEDVRVAFRWLEDFSLDPFPEADMRRGLKPIADAVVKIERA
jgi:hypothetical protein